MQIHRGLNGISKIKNAVVTTGTFDGVHIGHQVILRRLNILAAEIDGESVLITFWPHPRKVLYPETKGKNLKMIASQKEKITLLQQTGLDHLVILEFTKEFSEMSSEKFIMEVFVKRLQAKRVIVGYNHYFGHNREGNFDFLRGIGKEYGFEVEEIPEQDIQNESVSSTKIRQALTDGNIQKANAYLNNIYMISGTVKSCSQPFRQHSIQTFSLAIDEEDKLLPPTGIYAISVEWDNNRKRGICFHIPASDGSLHLCFKLFDQTIPLVNQEVTVFFYKRIRGQEFFSDPLTDNKQLTKALSETMELIY
ncbi:MAG: hypothetical protein R6T91_01870 [Bacteroidales bacterium]